MPNANGLLKDLRWHSYLTARCNDEHEPYFPADGTYYSSCGYFRRSGLAEIKGFWKKTVSLIRAGRAPKEVGLYIHWPFCVSRCQFCFCSMGVARGAREIRDYACGLKREIDALRPIFDGIEFSSVYFGGGTPTAAPEDVLDGLFTHVAGSFRMAGGAEFYVEASPRTLTTAKMELLTRRGVNRVTLGVQSLDETVLARNNRRGQTRADVDRAIERILAAPGVYSGVELMFGLEGQTFRSFLDDFESILRKGLDAVYVFGFDPRPQTPFAQAGKALPGRIREGKVRMLPALRRLAHRCGYRQPTASPKAPGYLRTISSQCRTARRTGASILGLGAGALAHAYGAAWYRHPPIEESKRRWNRIQPFYCLESDLPEEMRGYAVRHMYSQGEISRAGFRGLFGRDVLEAAGLSRTLRAAQARGEVRIDGDTVAFRDPDRAKRIVFAKRLYSPRLHTKLKAAHRRAFDAFNDKHTDEAVREYLPVADKRVAALMTTFERVR